MIFYCWRCSSDIKDMEENLHFAFHKALDDMRAYGVATMRLNINGEDKTVQIKPENKQFDLRED